MSTKNPSRSLAGIAGIVAVATLISKVFGLVRQQAIAAAFGIGPVVNAYTYAYIIPSFLLILLGGINGPFHSALVSVLAKRTKAEAAPLVETVSTIVSGVLMLVTVMLIFFAGTFIDLLAPGLDPEVRRIAILQLQIMAPLATLAGLIGIGFGTLNASDQYWLPSISPLFSSLVIVCGVGMLWLWLGEQANDPQYFGLGGVVLAGGTFFGALLQWVAQLIAQWRSGMGRLRLRFNWRTPGVREVIAVMVPATFSSGMLYINLLVDMQFASYIDGAAAAISFANFIVLTPVGIISNMILVPMLPVFSRLAAPENWQELKVRIRQGLLLSALTMLPLSAIFIPLALPIIKVVYEHANFNAQDSRMVAPVLAAYGVGMFFYLGRDVLVRVFYSLGDGKTPFRVSIINIFINVVLDYFLVRAFATSGIVFATIGVNIVSMVMFLWLLNGRLNGLPLGNWSKSLLGIVGSSFISGLACWGTYIGLERLGIDNFLMEVLQLGVAVVVALGIFILLATQLKLPEVDILVSRIRQKLVR